MQIYRVALSGEQATTRGAEQLLLKDLVKVRKPSQKKLKLVLCRLQGEHLTQWASTRPIWLQCPRNKVAFCYWINVTILFTSRLNDLIWTFIFGNPLIQFSRECCKHCVLSQTDVFVRLYSGCQAVRAMKLWCIHNNNIVINHIYKKKSPWSHEWN